MSLDLLGEFLHHVDFPVAGLALFESLHHLLRPLASLTAGGALPAALVLVEASQSTDGPDDVGALVHDDQCRRSHARLTVL